MALWYQEHFFITIHKGLVNTYYACEGVELFSLNLISKMSMLTLQKVCTHPAFQTFISNFKPPFFKLISNPIYVA